MARSVSVMSTRNMAAKHIHNIEKNKEKETGYYGRAIEWVTKQAEQRRLLPPPPRPPSRQPALERI